MKGFSFKKDQGYDNYDTMNDMDNGFESMDDMGMDDGFGAPEAPLAPEPAAFAPAAPALKIVNPKEYKDAVEIANLLINGNTILLNIEAIAKEPVVIRILDYLAGAVHVAGGVITKVSKTTIVIAPKNVDVSSIEAMVSNN